MEDFYLLTKRCLEAEVEGDENIDDFYIGFLPEVNPKKIKPFTFMKSANHGLCLTNPGVKKDYECNNNTGDQQLLMFQLLIC